MLLDKIIASCRRGDKSGGEPTPEFKAGIGGNGGGGHEADSGQRFAGRWGRRGGGDPLGEKQYAKMHATDGRMAFVDQGDGVEYGLGAGFERQLFGHFALRGVVKRLAKVGRGVDFLNVAADAATPTPVQSRIAALARVAPEFAGGIAQHDVGDEL